jgi:hypothetical protein
MKNWNRISLAAAAIAGLVASFAAIQPALADGAKLTIHNGLSQDVDIVVWEGDGDHKKGDAGGITAGHFPAGAAGSANVTKCHFTVYLFAKDGSVHHKQFTDCSITDITIKDADH